MKNREEDKQKGLDSRDDLSCSRRKEGQWREKKRMTWDKCGKGSRIWFVKSLWSQGRSLSSCLMTDSSLFSLDERKEGLDQA